VQQNVTALRQAAELVASALARVMFESDINTAQLMVRSRPKRGATTAELDNFTAQRYFVHDMVQSLVAPPASLPRDVASSLRTIFARELPVPRLTLEQNRQPLAEALESASEVVRGVVLRTLASVREGIVQQTFSSIYALTLRDASTLVALLVEPLHAQRLARITDVQERARSKDFYERFKERFAETVNNANFLPDREDALSFVRREWESFLKLQSASTTTASAPSSSKARFSQSAPPSLPSRRR
jgi:hypothetical protein